VKVCYKLQNLDFIGLELIEDTYCSLQPLEMTILSEGTYEDCATWAFESFKFELMSQFSNFLVV
jgi:hypothetical protein